MQEEFKSINTSTSALRKFGWTMGIIALAIFGFLYWKQSHPTLWVAYLAGAFLAFGTILPIALKPFYIPWMMFSIVLGNVMSRVVLSILFFLILTPLALTAKICRKKFLERSWDTSAQSYWITRTDDQLEPSQYEKQF